MAVLGEHGLVTLWERIKRYVRWYVDENFPIASVSKIGGIRPDNNTVTVEPNGTLHARQTPIATTDTAGKVMPDGTTITVDEDGVIHGVEQYVLPVASDSQLGGVKSDNDTVTVAADGTISVANAVTDADRTAWYAKADWDESDSDSPSYIENRPFYRELVVGSTVISQRRFGGNTAWQVIYHGGGNFDDGYALVSENISLQTAVNYTSIKENEYMVTVDDTSTIATTNANGVYHDMKTNTDFSGIALVVPNAIIIVDPSSNYLRASLFLPGTRNKTVPYKNVSVSLVTETVSKIDRKYLPIADRSSLGAVKPDGYSITVDDEGTIELGVANYLGLGGVRIREDGYIGIDDGYLYLKCDVADSDVVDSYTKDDSGEAILFPGGSAPTYLIDHNTLRRLWENVTEYVQENSDTGELESGLSIRNYTESNDLYRFLGNVLNTVTVIPWTTVSGSGTFTTDDSMGTSREYVLVYDGKCYFDAPTEYSNGKRLEFNLPNNERVVIGITDNGSSRTLSTTCTDGGSHQIMLARFQELGTADLSNNVGGVGFLMRNEYATTSRAGVVKVGSGLVVSSDGTLSVDMTNLNEVSF